MMRTRAMLADDLTGAMDAGMQLVRPGGRVLVALSPAGVGGGQPDCGWLIVNTGSRNLSAREAKRTVADSLARLEAAGVPLGYKKIDSTLRGNLGAELEALLAQGARQALVAPALPSGGRTTVGGRQYVNGRPLAENELAKDPFSPIAQDDIPTRIAAQCGAAVARLGLEALRGGGAPDALARMKDARIVVADAQTDDDLKRLAELCAAHPSLTPCGSAGLIAALAPAASEPPALPSLGGRPALILCGSPARLCKRQLRQARERVDGLALISADPPPEDEARLDALLAELCGALGEGRHAALDASANGKDTLSAAYTPDELRQNSLRVQRTLNAAAQAAYQTAPPGAMILLGGDSAAGVLTALGVTRVELLGAAQPLMPCGRCLDGLAAGSLVVTKAGGFGQDDSILRIMEAIS